MKTLTTLLHRFARLRRPYYSDSVAQINQPELAHRKMSLPQNFFAYMGATALGIVGAAMIFAVEQHRQDKRRHAMAKDLARLDSELGAVRRELDELLALQQKKARSGGSVRRKRAGNKAESIISSSTATEDYSSALDLDSSDLEFYDVSDDDETDTITSLDTALKEIDQTLDLTTTTLPQFTQILDRLENLCLEHPSNPHLLFRIGKCHFKLSEKVQNTDPIMQHLDRGIDACKSALKCKPELAEAHKWLAILLGTRTDHLPIKEKIQTTHLFKEHVDAAILLNPSDSSLHHMLGRFAFELAELKWYERKVAAALFADPPNATYDEALEHFLEADKLSKVEWKQNKLCIAKCRLKLGQVEEGLKVLKGAADSIGGGGDDNRENPEDEKADSEIKELLSKYSL